MRRNTDAPTLIGTIADHDVTALVWLDTDPDMRAVLVSLEEWGQELHLPIVLARRVADAILRAAAPAAAAWCEPARCAA